MPLPVPRLVARTREVGPIDDLLAWTSPDHPTAWLRRGDGIIGYGSVTGVAAGPGADPSPLLAERWQRMAAEARVDDEVGLAGTGLVAFGSIAFDPRSTQTSRLSVPAVVLGRRGGRYWRTTIHLEGEEGLDPVETAYGPHWSGTVGPGALTASGYQDAVRSALRAITAGEVEKVVVARDLRGTVPAAADLRRLVRSLASDYPDTWNFAVDDLIGASPETLVTVRDGVVTARVLAGTRPRGADLDGDLVAEAELMASPKDRDEHAFAVQSVLAALRPHTRRLAAADAPFALKLPNVWHLATDVEGTLADAASALDMVSVLHPTAAVAGTPTAPAVALIHDLEPFDRGRYAGPVGWIDGNGDGEWAIALRCAQFGGETSDEGRATIPVTAYAGAGIVAGSDPESELTETRVKFRPIIDALT